MLHWKNKGKEVSTLSSMFNHQQANCPRQAASTLRQQAAIERKGKQQGIFNEHNL
jgi:hypothetical protein